MNELTGPTKDYGAMTRQELRRSWSSMIL